MTAALAALSLPLAATSLTLYHFVFGLFTVYTILILLNILLSFVPRIPYYPWLRAVLDFITESTDPYLNVFRAMMRPIGGSAGLALDFSPILALLVLGILNRIVVGAFF